MAIRLTKKQRKFVQGYIESGNGTQAALNAYRTSDPSVAKVIASQNLTKLNVREAIEAAFERTGLTLEYACEKIKDAIDSGVGVRAKNSDAIRGAELLLKLHGAFPGQKTSKFELSIRERAQNMTYSELKAKYEKTKALTEKLMNEPSLVENP